MAASVNVPASSVSAAAPVSRTASARDSDTQTRLLNGALPSDRVSMTLAAQMLAVGRLSIPGVARARGLALPARTGARTSGGRPAASIRRERRNVALDLLGRALAVDAAV